jgi:transposase
LKLPKKSYTAEFKEQAVAQVNGGRGIAAVAKELGMCEQTLRNWVKAAGQGKLVVAGSKAVSPEQMELSRLRAENARLKRDMEIVKKAAAYFAKDVL